MVQLMTNAVSKQLSVNSLHSSVQQKLKDASYNFGMALAKNANFNMNNGSAEFMSRTLTYIFPEILLQRFPELTFRLYTDILGAPIYDIDVAFNIADMTGTADIKTSTANDFDIADINLTEEVFDILQTGTAITFTFIESQAAEALASGDTRAVGRFTSILRTKMQALMRMSEAKKNKLFFQGSSSDGVTGILTNPDMPSGNAAAAWTEATDPNDMLNDVIYAINKIRSQSKGCFSCNTLAMSNDKFTLIQGKARSLYSDFSVLGWIKANFPEIERIIPDPYLDGQGDSGTGVILTFDRDRLNANMIVSADLVGRPVQYRGQQQINPYISRMTGYNLLQGQSHFRYVGI